MALVLSRKRNESFRIGHDIVVSVVEIRGEKVRLAIEAPKDIPVHREEVFRAIQRESGLAALRDHLGAVDKPKEPGIHE